MLGYNDNMRWGESIETQDESKSFYAKALKFKIINGVSQASENLVYSTDSALLQIMLRVDPSLSLSSDSHRAESDYRRAESNYHKAESDFNRAEYNMGFLRLDFGRADYI